MFVLQGLTVTIIPRFQEKIQRGELCPDLSTFELSFNIISDILETGTDSFKFDVSPSKDIERISFAGVDPDQAYVASKGKKFKRPTIEVGIISLIGVLDINFSEPFLVPDDLKLLKAEEFIIDGLLRSNLELIIEPVEGQTEDQIKFDWYVVSFQPDKLTLQIEFDKPYEISQAYLPNTV